MYDYQYGTSTKSFKQDIEKMRPKLPLRFNQESKNFSLMARYLNGLDVISLSQTSKKWYTVSWHSHIWKELSESLCSDERLDLLKNQAETKLRVYDKRVRKNDLSDLITDDEVKEAVRWKLIYGQLFYNYCSYCKIQENKLRFLPILQKSLCYNCAKLPVFDMISLENAETDYSITRKHINDYQVEGLKVPDTGTTNKFMLVYYVSDIIRIKSSINYKNNFDKVPNREFYERRRTEMIYCMKKEGIDERFIDVCLDTEGSLVHNYLFGKSKMSSGKIAKKMLKKYEKWLDQEQEDDVLPEPEVILPLKRPVAILTGEEKTRRKNELIERLLVMGVTSDLIGLDDYYSLASAYIDGRTKEDLGPVAGAIWREHKPVFNGVPFRIAKPS